MKIEKLIKELQKLQKKHPEENVLLETDADNAFVSELEVVSLLT